MTGILFSDRSGYRVLDSEVERFIAANVRTGKKPGPKPKDGGGQLRVAEERPRYTVSEGRPPEQAPSSQGKAVAA